SVGVSGSGNVAIYAIEKIQQLGGVPVTASDSSGYVVDENGIDVELLRQIKEVERDRIHEYAERRGNGARFIEGGSVWDVPVAIALPGATQNELDGDAARTLIRNGVGRLGGREHALHPRGGRGVRRGRGRLRTGQGRQCRGRGHQRAGDAAERFTRRLELPVHRGA